MPHRLPLILTAVTIIALAGALVWSLPLAEWLSWIRHWIQNMGIWGVAAFVVLYSVFTIFMTPVLPLTLIAGLVYGAWGFPLTIVSATIAASLAFLISRHLLHDRVERSMQDNMMFHAIKQAVSSNGWKMTLLVRLSPVFPFSVQNYSLGITDIQFYQYSIASFFGMMPACALYVYLGSLGASSERGAWQWALLVVGAIATIAIFWLMVTNTKRALMKIVNDNKGGPAQSD